MNAKRDENRVKTLLGTDSSDGSTPINISVDPTTYAILASDGTTGSDLSGDVAARDSNRVPVLIGVSSADGMTPVPVYVDSATGSLLVKST